MKNHALTPPEWLARSSILQINPRTFSEQGTLQAITDELPFLKSCGFTVIYLSAICQEDDSADRAFWSERQKKYGTENPKNPYRINDYFSVDEEYGTNEDLKKLIQVAHKLHMRVLLDLVYFHMGPHAPILQTHPEFAKQDENGAFLCGEWHFPILDFRYAGLREYLYANMVYYIGVMDADGFRCDVGDNIPEDFWVEARRRIKAIKPDAVLIDEGMDYKRSATAFDAIYCFEWHELLYKIFCGGESADALRSCYERLLPTLPQGTLLLRDLDNHDTVTDWEKRVESVVGSCGMEQILLINFLTDGIPMVYGGNEIACEAKVNMFANRFYKGIYQASDRQDKFSEKSLRRQNFLRTLHRIKREWDVLRYGQTVWFDTEPKNKCLSFTREYEGQKILFFGNTTDKDLVVNLHGLDENTEILFRRQAVKQEGLYSFSAFGYLVLRTL